MKKIFAVSAAVSAFASGAFAQSVSEEAIVASTQNAGNASASALLLAGLFLAVIISAGSSNGGSAAPVGRSRSSCLRPVGCLSAL